VVLKNDSSRWARTGTTISDVYYDLLAPSIWLKNDFNAGNLQISPIIRFEALFLTKNDLLLNASNTGNTGENFGDVRNNFSEFTPGLNIIYRNIKVLNSDLELYGSIYKGYSSPTTAIAFVTVENGEVVPTVSDETNMEPEVSINTEIGSRFSNINQVFNGQVAVFNMDITHFYSPARNQAFESLGRVRISGLECALNMNITKPFQSENHQVLIGAALTFMNSEITGGSLSDYDLFSTVVHSTATQEELINRINSQPEAYDIYIDGLLYTGELTTDNFDQIDKVVITYGKGAAEDYKVPYVPEIILNANLNYRYKQFSADVSINYTGEQYSEFFNFNSESADGSIGKLEAYSSLNANLNYTLERESSALNRITFFVAGKNILDQIYRSSRLNRAAGGLFPYGFRQINAGVSIRI
jgi:Fe(3+) dicitrate transport protein